jgi:hypothetical protein
MDGGSAKKWLGECVEPPLKSLDETILGYNIDLPHPTTLAIEEVPLLRSHAN